MLKKYFKDQQKPVMKIAQKKIILFFLVLLILIIAYLSSIGVEHLTMVQAMARFSIAWTPLVFGVYIYLSQFFYLLFYFVKYYIQNKKWLRNEWYLKKKEIEQV